MECPLVENLTCAWLSAGTAPSTKPSTKLPHQHPPECRVDRKCFLAQLLKSILL